MAVGLPGAGQEGGVEEGDTGQPGEEGAVLDRVPGPVAAPPELDVGPVGTGDESDGQKDQAGHHVPAGDGQPVPHRPGQEGGDRHRHGHGQTDIAAVQKGRVVEHRRVAEDRRQPAAVDGGDGEGGEGAGHRHQESEEDGRLQRQHRLGAAGQLRQAPPQRPRRQEGPAGQHPRPEEERARHTAPQPGQAVGPGGVPAGVVGHVDEGVVLAHEGPRQSDQTHRDQPEHGHQAPTTPVHGTRPRGHRRRDRRRQGQEQRSPAGRGQSHRTSVPTTARPAAAAVAARPAAGATAGRGRRACPGRRCSRT